MDGDFLPATCGTLAEAGRCSVYELFKSGGGNPVPTIVAVTAEELELDDLLMAPPQDAAEMRSELVKGLSWQFGDKVARKVDELMDDPWYKVSFQWKNPDFLIKNPDFVLRNVDFLLRNVDSL